MPNFENFLLACDDKMLFMNWNEKSCESEFSEWENLWMKYSFFHPQCMIKLYLYLQISSQKVRCFMLIKKLDYCFTENCEKIIRRWVLNLTLKNNCQISLKLATTRLFPLATQKKHCGRLWLSWIIVILDHIVIILSTLGSKLEKNVKEIPKIKIKPQFIFYKKWWELEFTILLRKLNSHEDSRDT
jgi:hypothetical protein